jgi:hypothetical protein
MRRALGLLALLAVMLAAVAHIVLRGSPGFAGGSGAVVQAALLSIDYASLILGASAGMFLMGLGRVFQGPGYPVRRGRVGAWSMRLAAVAVAAISIAALAYY